MLRTLREFAWPLSARGAYTILSDEDIEIGGLSDFNYCWHAAVGGTEEGVQVEGGAGVRGEAPAGGFGGLRPPTATKRTWNVSETNFVMKWGMICEDKKTNDNSPATICCQWFCPPLHLISVWLNSPFPIITKKFSKIFLNAERRKLCSVRNGSSVSSVSTAVNERGEGTVVAVRAYLFRCTSFPFYDCIPKTTEKETGFSVSKQS